MKIKIKRSTSKGQTKTRILDFQLSTCTRIALCHSTHRSNLHNTHEIFGTWMPTVHTHTTCPLKILFESYLIWLEVRFSIKTLNIYCYQLIYSMVKQSIQLPIITTRSVNITYKNLHQTLHTWIHSRLSYIRIQ